MAEELDLDEGINIKRPLESPAPKDDENLFGALGDEEEEDDLFGNLNLDYSPEQKRARHDDAMSTMSAEDPFLFLNNETPGGQLVASSPHPSIAGDDVGSVAIAPATPGTLVGHEIRTTAQSTVADKVATTKPRNRMIIGPQNPSFPNLMDRNMPSYKLQKERMDDTINNAPDQNKLNDFEQALLKLKGPRNASDRMTDVLAYDEAQAIVAEMEEAVKADEDALKGGFPAIRKQMLLDKICRYILRDKVGEQFLFAGGLPAIKAWISNTPGVPAKLAAPMPEIILEMLKVCERLPVKKDMLKETKIGVVVNRVWHNPKHSMEIRRTAERVCVKWLHLFQKPDDEDDAPDLPEPTDKKKNDDPDNLTKEVRPLIEQKRDPHFWAPSQEQMEANAHSMKNMRHAVRPMDKPVFSRDCLPDSMVSSKVGWNKTNPETTMGKVDRRVQALANPNKKAWKNALGKKVSVEGRGI